MLARTTSKARQDKSDRVPGWAALLERFYAKLNLPVPRIQGLAGEEMPEPYRGLLVHSSDMTPTLENFFGQSMRLSLLVSEQQDYSYLREVVLKSATDARPVEYGVIRIYLDHLPPAARNRVLEEQRPLGNILQTEAIPHLSWPQDFFKIQSDSHLGHVMYLSEPCMLYGRRNVLLYGSRRLLAEVIEILAPVL